MITESNTYKAKISYNNWKNFSYRDMYNTGFSNNERDFLSREGITFEDYVGCMNLTGNDLYCYPTLAKALRELSEYPLLARSYAVNYSIQGKSFLKYFYKLYHKSYWNFKQELAQASSKANNLIYLYGQHRQKPIINAVKKYDVYQGKMIDYITINGVEWYVNAPRNYDDKKQTERLDLKALFSIENEYSALVEAVTINTPFIGIRLKKNYKQKGHVVWFSLDTKAKVSKADRFKWQKGR